MAREIIDSYTGEAIAEEYVSPHKGINRPRTLFKPDPRIVAQYQTVPRAEGWRVLRDGCPEPFFPLFLSQQVAIAVTAGTLVLCWLTKTGTFTSRLDLTEAELALIAKHRGIEVEEWAKACVEIDLEAMRE